MYWNDDGKAKFQITSHNHGAYSVIGYAKTQAQAERVKSIAYARWGNAQIRPIWEWVVER
jgi:hypothetical protein